MITFPFSWLYTSLIACCVEDFKWVSVCACVCGICGMYCQIVASCFAIIESVHTYLVLEFKTLFNSSKFILKDVWWVLLFLDNLVGILQSLDRIKCRLLEGTNAQEVRAMVLDMQARLLLDMLGKGIESALTNPSALVPEPWQASSETLIGIDPEAMAVEPSLVPSIQVFSYTCSM